MRLFQVIRCLSALCLFATTVFTATPETERRDDADPRWEELESALRKEQPKTAVAIAESLAYDALKAGDYNKALRAMLAKAACVDDGKGEEQERHFSQIRELRAQLDKAPQALKPMLAAALARIWRHYYTESLWKLTQRSAVSASPDDFRTWDAVRVRAEIANLYSFALSDAAALRRTPVSVFRSIAAKEMRPENLRPSLYDFVTHDAIDFFSTDGANVPQTEDHFQPMADSPILGTLEEFLGWVPVKTPPARLDASAPELASITLFKDLLHFHLEAVNVPPDTRQSLASVHALAAADLSRLIWAGRLLGNADGAHTRLEQALRAFIERWKDSPIAADAAAELGLFLSGWHEHLNPDHFRKDRERDDTKPLEAYKVAMLGIALQPKSPGAARCRALIASLEAPELKCVGTEKVWNAPWPDIKITCANLDAIHLRIVPAEWGNLSGHSRTPDRHNAREIGALLKRKPVKAWRAPLPQTDYAMRTHSVSVPEDLKPGFYYIIASMNKDFSENRKKNALAVTSVWVSDLALVCDPPGDRKGKDGPWQQNGFLVNARTGVPVAGASVEGWHRNARGLWTAVKPAKTNASGAFTFDMPGKADNLMLLATDADGQRIATHNDGIQKSYGDKPPERTRFHIHFLTDRAIYRPGQTIQFKAVVYSANHATNKATVAPGRKIIVVLDDAGSKETGRVELYTNGYGSASGSFVVPAGRLAGTYTLHTTGPENGRGYIRIEEYKRPKFEVILDAPTAVGKLDGPVSLSGTATAFTGAPIDGAKVKWRVERGTRWPSWCWWRLEKEPQAIAHGSATCSADGSFKITFTATADKKINTDNEPYFYFIVFAEVTDSTGETQGGERIVTIGHSSLRADIKAAEWLEGDKVVPLKIETQTLDGIPQKTSGQLVVYSLMQPPTIVRPSNIHHFYQWTETTRISNLHEWEAGDGVVTQHVNTNEAGTASTWVKLPAGAYRIVFTTQDRYGKAVSARKDIIVQEPEASRSTLRVPFLLTIEKDELQPGDTFNALWSSGYDSARAFVTLSHRGRVLQQFWTDPTRTQQKITLPVTESLRGGFTLNIWQVRDNRIYKGQRKIRVDWKNKELGFAWERFNSKLVPGGRETWILRVIPPAEPASSPPSAQQVALPPEVAVALYDDSLEKIDRHNWTSLIGAFYQEGDTGSGIFTNFSTYASVMTMEPAIGLPRSFGDSLYDDSHYDSLGGSVWSKTFREFYVFRPSHLRLLPARKSGSPGRTMNSWSAGGMASSVGTTIAAADSLTAIVPRRNLAETNFFQPALIAGSDGTVRIEFTASEALTRWRFHAFAHDGQLRSGSFADASIVTAKSLMVQPQPPRFLREGDTIEFTVKLTNRSDKLQSGRARLNFADALSLAPADARLGNTVPERSFELAPHSSQSLSWRIAVPAGQGWLTYKAVASAGPEADGEEGWLPVLSRTQLVTESLAFQLRARAPGDSVNASYDKLLASAAPDAITRHEALTVQVASNPAWYAILALPFLMEQEYECSELVFNRFYANQLAAWLAQSDPRIVRVFQAWKNTPALKSPLFKNEELKSLLIAETPWVRDAEGETAQRQNIGALFDANRIAADSAATLRKLLSFQQPEGYWTWFPGCERDEYTTTLIAAGFGRMRQIGIPVDITPGKRAISALDARLASKLEDIKKKAAKNGTDYRTGNHIQTSVAHYLYARSFYHDVPAGKAAEALAFFHEQAACHWAGLPLQSQAHIAIALQRRPTDKNNATSAQQDILRSLRERARQSPELGTYWAPATEGYFWWHAPIETHALLIECFAEMGASAEELDSLQLWLLRQKQTQAWRTTKATADAIHAILLLNKNNRLDISAAATVTLGGKPISPVQTEAGTGFFSKRIPGVQVSPDMGAISLSRPAAGISWGSMTWQYHQDLDKITAHENSSLKISKSLWRRVTTAKGTGLEPVGKDTRKLQVGDTLVIRLIFRVSHEMEFVHLKDQRGSGLEPVETRSGYRWKNNLGYYESTRDTATHFFIRHLNPGVHVFEYSVRVQHRGQYQSGIAELQCMYAPEFNAHSASILLDVE